MHTCCTQQNYFIAIKLEGVTSLRASVVLRRVKLGRSEYLGYVNSNLHVRGNTSNFVDVVGRAIGAKVHRIN